MLSTQICKTQSNPFPMLLYIRPASIGENGTDHVCMRLKRWRGVALNLNRLKIKFIECFSRACARELPDIRRRRRRRCAHKITPYSVAPHKLAQKLSRNGRNAAL